MRMHFQGITDEDRRRFRQGLFEVTHGNVREDAAILQEALTESPCAVLAPRAAIEAAQAKVMPPFEITALE
ncbi:MAG: hypothetical protein HYY16_16160 [Planctomycetes bacterium]|nr:hypothetical protein [Planctomycetota bacterium]